MVLISLSFLRKMCGYVVYLRIKMSTFLELACFCPKYTGLLKLYILMFYRHSFMNAIKINYSYFFAD